MSDFDQDELHHELLAFLHSFRQFGATASGGVTRLAASPEEAAARDHLCDWFKANEFDIQIDSIGNIFGFLDFGTTYGDRAFYCGSHLDSQPEGGNFDGVLGVASACIAGQELRKLIQSGTLVPTYRFFVVVCWTGEEGARYQPSLLGSSVFCGQLPPEVAWKLADSDGVQLKDALTASGYLGADLPIPPEHYLELHIEQGTRLESSGDPIGLVEACWGAIKVRILVKGRADHTGPTPLEDRRDALFAASLVVNEVNALSSKVSDDLRGSVGRMEIHPNSPNTIADRVELWIELRSASDQVMTNALETLKAGVTKISDRTGCQLPITSCESRNAIQFDQPSLSRASQALDAAGISFQRLKTIAGHDAIRLQSLCPSILIFAPSKYGITHSPDEFTSDSDVCAAFEGMLVILLRLMSEESCSGA